MSKTNIDDVKRLLAALAKKYNARSVYLFGSYARGEENDASDIDVLVDGGEQFVPADIFAIAEELHMATGQQVDVYEQREVNPGTQFADSIMHERVRVA